MHSYVGLDYITEITIAGQDGFFNNLLEICGGENVYKGALPFPSLSREAIFTLNPDVIIDLLRSELEGELALKAWLNLTNINAVKNNRLYMFTDEADSVPGPRIYNTIRKISLAVHPAE
jgi:iron complex transport system substrate-binding protein